MSNETKTTVNEQTQTVVEATAEPVSEKQVEPVMEVTETPKKKNWVARACDWVSNKASTPKGEVVVKVATGAIVVVAVGATVAVAKTIKNAMTEDNGTDSEPVYLPKVDSVMPDLTTKITAGDNWVHVEDITSAVSNVADTVTENVSNIGENIAENVNFTE